MHQAQPTPEVENLLNELMNVDEAARFLGVSVDFLNRRRMRGREGQGPNFFRVARKIRYKKEDLIDWVASQQVNPHQ